MVSWPIAFRPVVRWHIMVGVWGREAAHIMTVRKQKETERGEGSNTPFRGKSLVT
jgi:hypothetical protein